MALNKTERRETGYRGLNRHTVMHGGCTDYGTQENSLKAFSLLFLIVTLAEPYKKSLYKKYPKYKDSGVEWIGDVPEHWDVVPYKLHIERNDGGVWGGEPNGINDTPVLRSTEQTVDGNWSISEPALRKLTETEKASFLLIEEDLLITKSSGSSLHIGKTTLVNKEIERLGCCYSNFMQRIRLKPSFKSRLAWFVMNNTITREQLDLASNSTTGLANLNGGMIGQLCVAIPPIQEQFGIIIFLDRETTRIDTLIAKTQHSIDLLKERRSAFITAAVTGKIDLRDSHE